MTESLTDKGTEGRAVVPIKWHQIGISCRRGKLTSFLKCQLICADEEGERNISGTETDKQVKTNMFFDIK